jgi:serine/threonine protein kinase
MELVVGIDLRHVLRHIAYSVGPMPVPLALATLIQCCDALEHAHGLGFVHRDVSPANIIVGTDGVVKIIDFGIAKASSATLFTASGQLKGKFSYMAPESLRGDTDARSDLFALGICLYEMLTARPLFKGATDFDTLEMVKRTMPPPPSSVNAQIPLEVDHIVMTALAKQPANRWQSALAMRNAMASLAERPGMRAVSTDVPRWIEWALAMPTRKEAWDEQAPPGGGDDPSVVISMESRTMIGAPPAPVSAPMAVPQVLPPTVVANPLANPEYAAAQAMYQQREQAQAVVALPGMAAPKAASRWWIVIVLLLCTGAAVGGFFLVDALM